MNNDEFTFEGFEPANTTAVPDVLFDVLLPHLTEAELKVLLYIIRRTSGFKKSEDAISFSQFQNGITTREGKVLDHGCGVKSRTSLSKALISLEQKGCITSDKSDAPQGDKAVTIYKIRFHSEGVVRETYQGSTQSVPPVVREMDYGSTQDVPGVVRETYPQLNSNTRDRLQDTVKQKGNVMSASAEHDAPAQNIIPENVLQEKITDKHKAVKVEKPKPKQATLKTPEEIEQDERCKALQKRINEWRGYELETKGQKINESKAIRTLVQRFTDERIEQIYLYLFNRHWKWSKPDNRYHIGAYVILSESGSVEQELKKPVSALKNGTTGATDIYTQASLDPERNNRNIERLKQKAALHGHTL